jgi:transposase
MTGRKEEAYFAEAERLFVHDGKTAEEIAGILPVCANTVYKWKQKGGWEEKRRAALKSPRSLAARMRAALDVYLKSLEAQAENCVLDNATFDAINKAVAAIRGVERQEIDLGVMSVEVMRRYTDFLKAQEVPAGELQLHGERIRAYFRSLE